MFFLLEGGGGLCGGIVKIKICFEVQKNLVHSVSLWSF